MEKRVLVTGASSGIGRATAAELLRAGFARVFAGVRRAADGQALRAELGPALTPLTLDVTDAAAIAGAVTVVSDDVGAHGLDGLVNNAGIGVSMPIEDAPLEVVRRQFEVNVFGQIAVTQAFLPLIRRARGRIVNTGSVGSHITMPFGGLLCASKAAFRSLNDALRLELHPFGIHVAIVEPGAIDTPAVEKMLGDVEGTLRELRPGGAARYGAMLREFTRRAYERERRGSPPEAVARVIRRALTDARPRACYPAGAHARAMGLVPRVLPEGVLDRVRLRLFGLPRRFGAAAPDP
jgi:NAD(P)-dependent dehydrogenase (short-subunit alcohol dehydrogenase family)